MTEHIEETEKTETDVAVDQVDNEIEALRRELEGYERYGRKDRAAGVEDAIKAAEKRKKALRKGADDAPAPAAETATPPAPGTPNGPETATPPPPSRPAPAKRAAKKAPAKKAASAAENG